MCSYYVVCLDEGCSNRGKTAYTPAQAALNWNGDPCSDFPDYFDLPFLHLQGLQVDEVYQMLKEERVAANQEMNKQRDFGSKPGSYQKI